jgi:hypothetical protein
MECNTSREARSYHHKRKHIEKTVIILHDGENYHRGPPSQLRSEHIPLPEISTVIRRPDIELRPAGDSAQSDEIVNRILHIGIVEMLGVEAGVWPEVDGLERTSAR